MDDQSMAPFNTILYFLQCTGLEKKLSWEHQGRDPSVGGSAECAFIRDNATRSVTYRARNKALKRGPRLKLKRVRKVQNVHSLETMAHVLQSTGLGMKLTWEGQGPSIYSVEPEHSTNSSIFCKSI